MAATSIAAAGCGNQSGLTLARQACTYVNSSISLYDSSLTAKTQKQRTALANQAYSRLSLALQPAALATSDNSQWQALMTTISESSRVPESVLVSALQQQCAVADSQGGNPPAPTNPPTTPVS
jgi:translation initiation factor 2B subunit (eIF-2B alpha/beta/delta family)